MVDLTNITNYEVMQNDKYGRYLVSKTDLDSGELIFMDTPFAVGPKPDTPPLCLGCYCPVTENQTCSRCGWPCCGTTCEMSPHHTAECDVFVNARIKFQSPEDWTISLPQLDCITPLRLLLSKEKEPARWQCELEIMETHTQERRERPMWEVDQVNIINYLIDHCKLGNRFSKELVQRVCGILEMENTVDGNKIEQDKNSKPSLSTPLIAKLVNSVEIPSRNGFSIRAIYPRLAIAAHSCVPNITHIIGDSYKVHIRAAVPIKAGEPLYLCYTHTLSPTLERREHLLQSKFFNCDCFRCSDPTEGNTHMSTLKCSKCDNGVLLSINPLDDEAVWKCNDKKCCYTTTNKAVKKLLNDVQMEIDQLDILEPRYEAIQQREAILKKYESVFHPGHALLLSIKHALVQLYGKVDGYRIKELSDVLLEKKSDFCRELLKTLGVVAPGESRMRGMMLYEMHIPLMLMARNDYTAGLINREKLIERLQETLQCLADSARILMREDPSSHEGIIGHIAAKSFEQLKCSLDNL